MTFSSFFKKDTFTPEQAQELNDANMALRVRMDKIVHLSAIKEAVFSKPTRPIFEGRAAA